MKKDNFFEEFRQIVEQHEKEKHQLPREASWQPQSADAAGFMRRQQRDRRRRGIARALSSILILGALATLAGVGWSSGWLPAQLRPRSVQVRGAEMCSSKEVIAAAGCEADSNLLALWWRDRDLKPSGSRWLTRIQMHPSLSREAVLEVSERRPLVLVKSGRLQGWLCDDGTVVERDLAHDIGERFDRLLELPRISLPEGGLDVSPLNPGRPALQQLSDSEKLLGIVASCAENLPLQVSEVKMDADWKAELLLDDGFPVHLGELTNLDTKLAALPKALRMCEDVRGKLLYLDASDSGIFYQKWKEPQQAAAPPPDSQADAGTN